ncbi:hypothetical protein [Caldithrix abyssi]
MKDSLLPGGKRNFLGCFKNSSPSPFSLKKRRGVNSTDLLSFRLTFCETVLFFLFDTDVPFSVDAGQKCLREKNLCAPFGFFALLVVRFLVAAWLPWNTSFERFAPPWREAKFFVLQKWLNS